MTETETGATGTQTGAVFVRRGSGGWGDGLLLDPSNGKDIVLSVTGGGIHPVAAKIAELTGTTAVDAFTTSIPDEKVLAAVINCGGTARVGVYPRKRIPTVDVFPGEPGGPLAQFITPDIFVSDVGLKEIEQRAVGDGAPAPEAVAAEGPTKEERLAAAKAAAAPTGGGAFNKVSGSFVRFGEIVGGIVNTFLASGRQTIQLVLSTILPFMAYVSLLLGIVTYTGVATGIAEVLSPIATNPLGLIAIGIVGALPFLSPILGPGAAIAQVIGTLMGSQIAIGALPVQYALPTLFAINGQVGCDFIPVGLALGEAKPETVAVGTPAVLLSRLITAPIAVIIAYLVSFGLLGALMTYYESTVLRAGSEASELVDGGVLILYADPIPDALESVSVVHSPSGPPSAEMEPGHLLSLGDQQLRLTRVGDIANENLRSLGHVVVYVDPEDGAPLLPGAVHAAGPLVTPEAGAVLRLAVGT